MPTKPKVISSKVKIFFIFLIFDVSIFNEMQQATNLPHYYIYSATGSSTRVNSGSGADLVHWNFM